MMTKEEYETMLNELKDLAVEIDNEAKDVKSQRGKVSETRYCELVLRLTDDAQEGIKYILKKWGLYNVYGETSEVHQATIDIFHKVDDVMNIDDVNYIWANLGILHPDYQYPVEEK